MTTVTEVSLRLQDTRYGSPSQEAQNEFAQVVASLPPNQREVVVKSGTQFYALQQGQGLVGTGVFDLAIDPHEVVDLSAQARTIRTEVKKALAKHNATEAAFPDINSIVNGMSKFKMVVIFLDKEQLLGDLVTKSFKFQRDTPLYTWFLTQVRQYNLQLEEFSNPDNDLAQTPLSVTPQFYLFPNYCLIDRNAYSSRAPSGELVLVPVQISSEAASEWDEYVPTEKRGLLACHSNQFKVVFYRDDPVVRLLNMFRDSEYHEIGHVLQKYLRERKPGAEAKLCEAARVASRKALNGEGLAHYINEPGVAYIADDPLEEVVPVTYALARVYGPKFLRELAGKDYDWYKAYQVIENIRV